MPKIAVVAVGGNSLIIDEDHQTVQDQYVAAAATSRHITSIIEKGYRVIVTHGNGPQVGFALRRSEIAKKHVHQIPLDSCVAETQGGIGYGFQMALKNEFEKRRINKQVVSLITQVIVDKNDPAFKKPTKPIGSFFTKKEAVRKIDVDGWDMIEDAGRGWRRVVASPAPRKIVEMDAIKRLVDDDVVVIAAGGGGIPVVRDVRGSLRGVAAVIDKDYASALLAKEVGASLFLISTPVERVYLNYDKPNEKPLEKVHLRELKKYAKGGHFKKGSMMPKIESIIKFLQNGGERAIITDTTHIAEALEGKTGTHFVR